MNAGIPVALSVPLLSSICLILTARLVVLHSIAVDRRMNMALAFLVISCILRYRVAQADIVTLSGARLSPGFLYQLSELAGIPAAGALFLLAYSWIVDYEPRYLVRVVCLAVAVTTVCALALGLHARAPNLPFAIHTRWALAAYSSSPVAAVAAMVCHDSLTYWFSTMIIIACIRELRRRASRRGIAVSVAMATVAIGFLGQTASISLATIIAATGRQNDFIRVVARFDRFSVDIFTYIIAVVAGLPLITRILEAFHVDRHSLRRKRLLPLWKDLTTACPETIHMTQEKAVSNGSRYVLHRTVIEIRDCVLILSRYAGRHEEAIIREVDDRSELRDAVRLALAWSAKISGEQPSGDFGARQSVSTQLLDEYDELSRLADHWVYAKELAGIVASGSSRIRD